MEKIKLRGFDLDPAVKKWLEEIVKKKTGFGISVDGVVILDCLMMHDLDNYRIAQMKIEISGKATDFLKKTNGQ
jgi:hypothetical protein